MASADGPCGDRREESVRETVGFDYGGLSPTLYKSDEIEPYTTHRLISSAWETVGSGVFT
jgi:hypothetical protein